MADLKACEYYMDGNYDGAYNLFSEAIQKEPRRSKLFLRRGDCLVKLARLNEALQDYTQAFDMGEDDEAKWTSLYKKGYDHPVVYHFILRRLAYFRRSIYST